MTNFDEQFWITNISKMNVSLTDLALTVPALKTVNLLDGRHYSFEREALLKSATNGSIFKKRDKIKVRKVPPEINIVQPIEVADVAIPSRKRSIIDIENVKYDELDLSDDDFAQQAADFVDHNSYQK